MLKNTLTEKITRFGSLFNRGTDLHKLQKSKIYKVYSTRGDSVKVNHSLPAYQIKIKFTSNIEIIFD